MFSSEPEPSATDRSKYGYYLTGLPEWKQKLILARLGRESASDACEDAHERFRETRPASSELPPPGPAAALAASPSCRGEAASPADTQDSAGPDLISRASGHVGCEAEKNGPSNNRATELGLQRVSGKGQHLFFAGRQRSTSGSDRQVSRSDRPTWYRPPDEILVLETSAGKSGSSAAGPTPGSGCYPSGSDSELAARDPSLEEDGYLATVSIVHRVVNQIEHHQMETAAPRPPPRRKLKTATSSCAAKDSAGFASPPRPEQPVAALGELRLKQAEYDLVASLKPDAKPAVGSPSVIQKPTAGVRTNAGLFSATLVTTTKTAKAADRALDQPNALSQAELVNSHGKDANSNTDILPVRHIGAASDKGWPADVSGAERPTRGPGPATFQHKGTGLAVHATAGNKPATSSKPAALLSKFVWPPASAPSAESGQSLTNGPQREVDSLHSPLEDHLSLPVLAERTVDDVGIDRIDAGHFVPAAAASFANHQAAAATTTSAALPTALPLARAAEVRHYEGQVNASESLQGAGVDTTPGAASQLQAAVQQVGAASLAKATAERQASAPSIIALGLSRVEGASAFRSPRQDSRSSPSLSAAAAAEVPPVTDVARILPVLQSIDVTKPAVLGAAPAGVATFVTPATASQQGKSNAATSAAPSGRLTSEKHGTSSLTLSAAATGSSPALATTQLGAPAAASAIGAPGAGAGGSAVSLHTAPPPITVPSYATSETSNVVLPAAATRQGAGQLPAADSRARQSSKNTAAVGPPAGAPPASGQRTGAAHVGAQQVKATITISSVTTTSSSTDGAAGASNATAPAAAAAAVGTEPKVALASSKAQAEAKPAGNNEAAELLQAFSRRKSAVTLTADGERQPESGTGKRVFDTRSAMSKERKVPEYERIFEGGAVVFYNDNVIVAKGNLQKTPKAKTGLTVTFNNGLLSRIFEYPSEGSLMTLPKDPGSLYYDDPAKQAVTAAPDDDEPPCATRFGALSLDRDVILEAKPKGGSSHHLPGSSLVKLAGPIEPSNTDC